MMSKDLTQTSNSSHLSNVYYLDVSYAQYGRGGYSYSYISLERFLRNIIEPMRNSMRHGHHFAFIIKNDKQKKIIQEASFTAEELSKINILTVSSAEELVKYVILTWPKHINYCYYSLRAGWNDDSDINAIAEAFKLEGIIMARQIISPGDHSSKILIEQLNQDIQRQAQLSQEQRTNAFHAERLCAKVAPSKKSEKEVETKLSNTFRQLLYFININNEDKALKILEAIKNTNEFKKHINSVIQYVPPNVKDYYEESLLMCAAKKEMIFLVTALVECGADPNQNFEASINTARSSALYLAASQGHLEVVKFLVEKGANIEIGKKETTFILNHCPEKKGARLSPMTTALINGHFEIAEYLRLKGAELIVPTHPAWNSFYESLSYFKKTKSIEYILEKHQEILHSKSSFFNLYRPYKPSPLENKGEVNESTAIKPRKSSCVILQ